MARPTLIELNPSDFNYYPFMTSLDKCSEQCNAFDDLSTKICVASKTRNVKVKVLNMVTRMNKAKTLVKHISCDCKCIFNSVPFNSNQKWNNETCQCECKNCCTCKNYCIIVGNLANAFRRILVI